MGINLSLYSLVTYIVSKVHVFLLNKNSVMNIFTNTIYNTILNIRGDSVVDDANSLFEYVNQMENKDFTLDRVEESPKVYRR